MWSLFLYKYGQTYKNSIICNYFQQAKTALESKIADLKADNDARYKELTSGINLDEIKQRAQKLGMKPANENQIVYYEIEHRNNMDQYENAE